MSRSKSRNATYYDDDDDDYDDNYDLQPKVKSYSSHGYGYEGRRRGNSGGGGGGNKYMKYLSKRNRIPLRNVDEFYSKQKGNRPTNRNACHQKDEGYDQGGYHEEECNDSFELKDPPGPPGQPNQRQYEFPPQVGIPVNLEPLSLTCMDEKGKKCYRECPKKDRESPLFSEKEFLRSRRMQKYDGCEIKEKICEECQKPPENCCCAGLPSTGENDDSNFCGSECFGHLNSALRFSTNSCEKVQNCDFCNSINSCNKGPNCNCDLCNSKNKNNCDCDPCNSNKCGFNSCKKVTDCPAKNCCPAPINNKNFCNSCQKPNKDCCCKTKPKMPKRENQCCTGQIENRNSCNSCIQNLSKNACCSLSSPKNNNFCSRKSNCCCNSCQKKEANCCQNKSNLEGGLYCTGSKFSSTREIHDKRISQSRKRVKSKFDQGGTECAAEQNLGPDYSIKQPLIPKELKNPLRAWMGIDTQTGDLLDLPKNYGRKFKKSRRTYDCQNKRNKSTFRLG